MIAIFKRNLLLTGIMLLPYALLLRCSSLIFPDTAVLKLDGGILYQTLMPFASSQILQIILSVVFVFIEAWILNLIINRNRLAKIQNGLPGMIYILLISISARFHWLSPIIVANFFVVLGIREFYKIYKKPKSAINIFNAGLFFGLASLFFTPYLFLTLIGILGILILNSINLQRILQLFFGFFVCYYLSYVVFLNLGQSEIFLDSLMQFNFHNPFPMSIEGYVQLGILSFLIIIVLLSYNSYMIKKSIQAQQKINLFYWMLLFALPAGFFLTELNLNYLTITFLPLSVLLHMNIIQIKNNFIAEFFHFLILMTVLAYQFSVHLF